MKSYCMIRAQPAYRRDAFMSGLKAAGYDARVGPPLEIKPGDVLVTWNRGDMHDLATRFEKHGGTVLVAENGYVKGRHDGGDYYALAIEGHNGSGRWHVGGPERWEALGVELKPWRATGDHILVAPNRSFGRPDTIMPLNWAADVAKRLRKVTDRPIRVRPHPGNNAARVPLAADLENCLAVAIWSSSVGVKALIEGIPVICEAPWWICKAATIKRVIQAEVGHQVIIDRARVMHALAWAQWTCEEIASGEPFRRLLLSDSRQIESAAAL